MKFKRGHIPWNKGLTKKVDNRIATPWLGKKVYPHMREALRKSAQNRSGDKSYQWKGGGGTLICKYCKKGFIVDSAYFKRTRKYCSYICRSRANAKYGKEHPNWKDGTYKTKRLKVMNTFQYKEWRKAVFERDNYTCQKCFERGGKLNADHIKPYTKYPNLVFNVNNGRALCVSCHREETRKFLKEHWSNQFSYA